MTQHLKSFGQPRLNIMSPQKRQEENTISIASIQAQNHHRACPRTSAALAKCNPKPTRDYLLHLLSVLSLLCYQHICLGKNNLLFENMLVAHAHGCLQDYILLYKTHAEKKKTDTNPTKSKKTINAHKKQRIVFFSSKICAVCLFDPGRVVHGSIRCISMGALFLANISYKALSVTGNYLNTSHGAPSLVVRVFFRFCSSAYCSQ